MAHSMLKPYSLLLYFLAIVTFFFIGISYAGMVDAGKGQMLAGGAIVLGYGIIGAIIGFCFSLFIAYKSNRKTIIRTNIVLGISIIAFWVYFFIKFKNKPNEKIKEKTEKPIKTKPSTTVTSDNSTALLLYKPSVVSSSANSRKTGLGMFKPNFYKNRALYFYGNPNLDKSLNDHSPTDSITFKRTEFGGFDILTAPPWLVPDHLKLDYDILYFRVHSISNDFIKITVNSINGQTNYVSRNSGKMLYWPEFLLGVNSVELLNSENQFIYTKPLVHSPKIKTDYSFMKPLQVSQNWLQVELIDDNYSSVGRGWIKWINDGELILKYNLLS